MRELYALEGTGDDVGFDTALRRIGISTEEVNAGRAFTSRGWGENGADRAGRLRLGDHDRRLESISAPDSRARRVGTALTGEDSGEPSVIVLVIVSWSGSVRVMVLTAPGAPVGAGTVWKAGGDQLWRASSADSIATHSLNDLPSIGDVDSNNAGRALHVDVSWSLRVAEEREDSRARLFQE